MSNESLAVKILNLYALWYHKEMLDTNRTDTPKLDEFLTIQIGEGNIADLLYAEPELRALSKVLGLNG